MTVTFQGGPRDGDTEEIANPFTDTIYGFQVGSSKGRARKAIRKLRYRYQRDWSQPGNVFVFVGYDS